MRSVDDIVGALSSWAEGLDVEAVSAADCRRVFALADRLERIAAAVKAQAASRLVEGSDWQARASGRRRTCSRASPA